MYVLYIIIYVCTVCNVRASLTPWLQCALQVGQLYNMYIRMYCMLLYVTVCYYYFTYMCTCTVGTVCFVHKYSRVFGKMPRQTAAYLL